MRNGPHPRQMDQRDKQNLLVAFVAIALILATYWFMSELNRRGRLEQCLMARRRDCAQFSIP